MKLSLKGVAISSLIGGEDIALEELETAGHLPAVPVMSLKNWVRTGVEAVSIVGNLASKKEKIREPFAFAFYSNTPLFGKAVRDMVKEHLMGGTGTTGSGSTNVVVVQPQGTSSHTTQASPRRGIARNARAFAEAGALTY